MPLVGMKDMLQHAYQHGYAVGAFEVISLDFQDGIMQAAEQGTGDFKYGRVAF